MLAPRETGCFNPVCSAAKTEEDLLRCGRCKHAFYCDTKCQAADWDVHKCYCKPLAKAYETLRVEEERMATACPLDFTHTEFGNAFELHVGNFWSVLETRDYCRARYAVLRLLWQLSEARDFRFLVEEVAAHQLGLLRLSSQDNLGVRMEAPFTLVRLGRFRECLELLEVHSSFDGAPEHAPSSVDGQFPYEVRLKDEDVYAEPKRLQDRRLYDTLPLIVLKAAVAEELRAGCAQLDTLKGLAPDGVSVPLCEGVSHCLFGRSEPELRATLDVVAAQRDRCIASIFKAYPRLVPSFRDIDALMARPFPEYYEFDSPGELRVHLENGLGYMLSVVPGLKEHLRNFKLDPDLAMDDGPELAADEE